MPADARALRALILAAITAAPVAACLDKDGDDDDSGGATATDTDGGTDGGTDGTTVDTDTDTDGSTGSLPKVPDADYPVCEGESSKTGGPCCTDVYCMAGDGVCKDAADLGYEEVEELVGTFLGSGTCQCGEVEGPYAPRPEDEGDCCYLVPLQGCEGRPLVIAGRVRRAPLQRGPSAWSRADAPRRA